MPRNSGTYNPPAGQPVISGTSISSTVFNNLVSDLGNEITNSIPRDGSAPPTTNLPLGNFKITGLGAATLATDATQFQQVQNGSAIYLTAVAGTNAITASLTTPTLAAYVAGNMFNFTAAGTVTGATTININALGIKSIFKDGAALSAGDITTGRTYELIYDGTNFNLFGAVAGVGASTIQAQTFTSFTTSGTATAYTLTPTPALTALAANQRFNVTFNVTAGLTPTLAVSGLLAKSLKYYDATGTKQFVTSSNVVTTLNSDVIYDGTDYVVLTPLATATSKIQPVNGSVATNALTITLNPTVLDFRSTTLGSGTVSTVANTAMLSLIVPTTATLGTISAVQSRLVAVAINNAGTMELAVVNIAGGNDLSETGLISTTAISATATSSNVFYSTIARTAVAYRVVGYIDSTQATAGAWATAPSTIQGYGGQALSAMSSIGYSQTWQSVTASRAFATTYYNTTGKPISVSVWASVATAAASTLAFSSNGVVVAQCGMSQTGGITNGLTYIVPVGASYSVASTNFNLAGWFELR